MYEKVLKELKENLLRELLKKISQNYLEESLTKGTGKTSKEIIGRNFQEK